MFLNGNRLKDSTFFPLAILTASIAALGFLSWLFISNTRLQFLIGYCILGVLLAVRFFKIKRPRIILIFLVSYLSFSYLVWRVTHTITYHDPASFIFALLLFLAELYGFIVLGLTNFVNIKPVIRKSDPLPENRDAWPSVDIFIPTYNEDAAIVETTALAALQIDWPKEKLHIYVLDDGGTDARLNSDNPDIAGSARSRRQHFGRFCQKHGMTYLAREKNTHAKAGNLNAGLQSSSGELVLILDADHIPTTDILTRTAGSFVVDPLLFLVQTPHFFGNPDPIEKNLRTFDVMPSENEMFYQGVQLGLDYWNGAYFCGSAAVLRRRCLEENGGFAGQSITEDAETALSLHAAGYHSAYISRPMVCGLACESLPAFIQQRSRWAMGMVQIFLLKNPLLLKGLTIPQRICYMSSCFYWLFPFSRIFFLVSPLLFLFFGLKIYDTDATQFLIFALPHLIGVNLLHYFLFGRLRWNSIGDIYEIILSIPLLPALIGTFLKPRAPVFKVTNKKELLQADHASPFALPYVLLLLLNLAAFLSGVFRISNSDVFSSAIITMCWALLNCILLTSCVGVMLERRQLRSSPRLPARGKVVLSHNGTSYPGKLHNLSSSGAGFLLDPRLGCSIRAIDGLSVLTITDHAGRKVHLHGMVRNARARVDGLEVGFHFAPQSDDENMERIKVVFGDSGRWRAYQYSKFKERGIFRTLFFISRVGGTAAMGYLGHWIIKSFGGQPLCRPDIGTAMDKEAASKVNKGDQRIFRVDPSP